MKNTLILIALFFFSFSNAQGIIHIENYTPYSLYFQLHAELDDSCEYGLYGWNYTYPSGSEYTFDLPPNYPTGSSVTYTSYANAFIQTPNMTHFKKSPGTTLYPYNIAESIYGTGGTIPSHWSFLKFALSDEGNSFYCTIGLPSDCNNYSESCEDGEFYAEIFTLSGQTYFFVFPL